MQEQFIEQLHVEMTNDTNRKCTTYYNIPTKLAQKSSMWLCSDLNTLLVYIVSIYAYLQSYNLIYVAYYIEDGLKKSKLSKIYY